MGEYSAHIDIAMEHIYNEDGEEQKSHDGVDRKKNKHKQEVDGRG